ncbi:MAG: SET domain-containing protein-lysine N-methyltransferase, partial [Oceanospirillaceae bacterium]|nr:SET domain-containing protein-lysine N-methyltransferase [Oceanospirillaceae bacterium]
MTEVKLIYNLVCTYSYRISFQLFKGDQLLLGERIAISFGLSYANHSCISNAERINTVLDKFQNKYDGLVATQEIKQVEEITWNYMDDSTP